MSKQGEQSPVGQAGWGVLLRHGVEDDGQVLRAHAVVGMRFRLGRCAAGPVLGPAFPGSELE